MVSTWWSRSIAQTKRRDERSRKGRRLFSRYSKLQVEQLEARELLSLSVTSFFKTPTGFVVQFGSDPFSLATLNLYDGETSSGGHLGTPDISIVGANQGTI